MTLDKNEENLISFLPSEIWSLIFSYCDVVSLCRISQVCRAFNKIIRQESVWVENAKRMLITYGIHSRHSVSSRCFLSNPRLASRERCHVSYNWRKANFSDNVLIKFNKRYLPWLQLNSGHIWISEGADIHCYKRTSDGGILFMPRYTLKGHSDDVCRFKVYKSVLVSGDRDGYVCGWDLLSGKAVIPRRRFHTSDINCVDIWENIIVSASRDGTVKVRQQYSSVAQNTTLHGDRVWSVAINPSGRNYACGTAGCRNEVALTLWDLNTNDRIGVLGNSHRYGAGVLDIYYESPSILLSCGYDTSVRMWDLRTNSCILKFEDPYDTVVYCVVSDHKYAILAGTARYGVVRLWDRRMKQSMQIYYIGRGDSPIYSMVFDPSHLYTALDQSVNMLSFNSQY